MKHSIASNTARFNSNRMLAEYLDRCYLPASAATKSFWPVRTQRRRELAAWRRRVRGGWDDVRVLTVDSPPSDPLLVGSALEVEARVALGDLTPDDVTVQLYLRPARRDTATSRKRASHAGVTAAAEARRVSLFRHDSVRGERPVRL